MVAASTLRRRGAFGVFDDVQRETMPELHAGRAEDSAHRPSGSALLPDDLADVTLGDAQPNDSRVTVCDGFYRDAVWFVDQSTCYLGYKVNHILDRVFPCWRLGRLSHSIPSILGVTKKRPKPFRFSRLVRDSSGKCANGRYTGRRRFHPGKPSALQRPKHELCNTKEST
jgi:hypothetical protein